jgi:ketosteroid isomerase-like protein
MPVRRWRVPAPACAHDVDGIVSCFAEDYRNETPAHPAHGFVGCEQVRRNWEQIFAFVPDVTARLLASSVDGDTIWTEWEHSGTRADGSAHVMRGVIIFGSGGGWRAGHASTSNPPTPTRLMQTPPSDNWSPHVGG